jgi:glycosyltransferase involved in cell wall biosynthesis
MIDGHAGAKKRLALFLPNLGGGGAERVALALTQGFLDHGHEVDLVLARREGVLLSLVPAGVKIIDLGASQLRHTALPLARYLRARRPDAMHAMMWPLPVLAIIARTLARVETRIVGSEHTTLSARRHGLRSRAVRMLTRQAYLRADALIAVSAGVADDMASLVGLPRNRITVIHNPLLLPQILPDPAAAASRWPAGTKRILAVGALKEEKNYPLMLRALRRVQEKIPASLLILGDGQLRSELKKQIDDEGLGSAVVLAGFDTDPWPYFSAAHLFVLSSDCEGLPTVLIEALHAGLPIVSTDCPNGPREILAGRTFGDLVECGDETALVGAIIRGLSEEASLQAAARRDRALQLSGMAPLQAHLHMLTS